MKKIIYIVSILLLGSCASNPDSFITDNERVKIELDNKSTDEELAFPKLTSLITPALKWGLGKINDKIDKEAKKYVATYNGNITSQNFYTSNQKELANNTIKILRYNVKDKNIELNNYSKISLKFEQNNEKTLLRLKLSAIKINKSKAKLRQKDSTVDIKINIKLNAYWKTKDGIVKSETVGDVAIKMKDIILGEQYQLNNKCEDENCIEIAQERTSSWFGTIPISVDSNNKPLENARGNFNIEIEVTEMDDYGKRVEQFGELADKGSDALVDLVNDLLKKD